MAYSFFRLKKKESTGFAGLVIRRLALNGMGYLEIALGPCK